MQKELEIARSNFQLYLDKEAVEAFERLIAIWDGKHPAEAAECLKKLVALVRKGIRKELNLPDVDLHELKDNLS